MDEKQLQQEFIKYLAQKSGAQSQQELEAYIQQLGEEGLKQEYAQFMQMIQSAKNGAKLNYLRQLKGKCPEGYEMQFLKKGGQLCKQCVKKQEKMENGGELPSDPIEAFKCGRKMKKKKCEAGAPIEMDKCGSKMKKKEEGGQIPADKCGGKAKQKKACGGAKMNIPFQNRVLS